MRNVVIGLGAALLLAPVAASAQTAAESFSYTAPSGMFGEGYAKWQMYKFMHEDRERTERLRAGEDITTGSVRPATGGVEQVRRPGETGARRRTSR